MATEHSPEEIFEGLYAQAADLWGKEDAERQRQTLHQAAEEIASVNRWALPPDLEPRFF
ncbi:MAG TPA: hypothetical protein VIH59_10140 [Candidatus Tectomicrobia bacterium]|jgi:hypothetical protein